MDVTDLFPELSTRQVGILKALSHGNTNKYIGQMEGISERTVEYHIGQMIEILGAPENYNPRMRLAHLFYSRLGTAFMEVLRGS